MNADLEWSKEAGTWTMPNCSHKVDGVECGKPAVCVIKIQGDRLTQLDGNDTIGRGIGSTYAPICQFHKQFYPDHEGFDLKAETDESPKLS